MESPTDMGCHDASPDQSLSVESPPLNRVAEASMLENPSSSVLNVAIGQYSSAGVKPQNEDAIGIRVPSGSALNTKGIAAVIADGVSASEGGKEASCTAVTSFLSDYYSTHDSWSVEASGSKVLNALNRWLYGQGQHIVNSEKGYVTTFSALILKTGSAFIFHIGDSRVYRLRGGELEQITRDHTAVVGGGQRYLARALGIDLNLEVDCHRLDLHRDDIFILTTDGLHEWIKLKELQDMVAAPAAEAAKTGQPLDALCEQIVARALANGSDDNVSMQVVSVCSPGSSATENVQEKIDSLPWPPALAPGQVVDGWRVQRVVAGSGTNAVYVVENQADGRRGVLKAPPPDSAGDSATFERFVFEEWVGSRIASSQVAKIMRGDQPKTFLYYVSEYIEGSTLDRLLREHTCLPVVDAQNIITQVISGLRAFHRKDVVHQDVGPERIIYTGEGIKIIGFGRYQASTVEGRHGAIGRQPSQRDREYCAPEYLMLHSLSTRSDQFSLAVLFYKLLTGKHPYGEEYGRCKTAEDYAQLHYTPSYELNPLIPHWLDCAIGRALSIAPLARYATLAEFASDIKTPNPAYEQKGRTSWNLNRLWVWKLLTAVLVMTNAIALWWAMSP